MFWAVCSCTGKLLIQRVLSLPRGFCHSTQNLLGHFSSTVTVNVGSVLRRLSVFLHTGESFPDLSSVFNQVEVAGPAGLSPTKKKNLKARVTLWLRLLMCTLTINLCQAVLQEEKDCFKIFLFYLLTFVLVIMQIKRAIRQRKSGLVSSFEVPYMWLQSLIWIIVSIFKMNLERDEVLTQATCPLGDGLAHQWTGVKEDSAVVILSLTVNNFCLSGFLFNRLHLGSFFFKEHTSVLWIGRLWRLD